MLKEKARCAKVPEGYYSRYKCWNKGSPRDICKNKNFKEEKILKQIQTRWEIFQFPEKAEILLELRLN